MIMKQTPTIYKVHDQYLLNREKLFDIVKKEIDQFFLMNLPQDIEENGNYPISKDMTDIQNEFVIGQTTLPLDVLIVDEEHQDFQTNAQLFIILNLRIREEIFGDDYD
jgi:hypothetical protein